MRTPATNSDISSQTPTPTADMQTTTQQSLTSPVHTFFAISACKLLYPSIPENRVNQQHYPGEDMPSK